MAAINTSIPLTWLIIGFGGQFLFFMRFLWQWIVSERQHKSVIPTAFWYFSIVGGLITLVYAFYRQDPVFIAGQLGGVLVYGRNLYFIYNEKRKQRIAEADELYPELEEDDAESDHDRQDSDHDGQDQGRRK